MAVFHITTNRINSKSQPIWHIMELPFSDIAGVVSHLEAGRLLHGHRLVTQPDAEEPDAREIVSTEELALAPSTVTEVRVSRTRIVRYEA